MSDALGKAWLWLAPHWKLLPVAGLGGFLIWWFRFKKARAEAKLAEHQLKTALGKPVTVSSSDPRIVPIYERGTGGRGSAATDDKLVLTNHGGGDAFDVQVGEIETDRTKISFARVPMIPAKHSESVIPNLEAAAYGRTIKLPFHDLVAYCEDAAQRGQSAWPCRITYRDFSGNWFETRFALKHTKRYEVQTEGFEFARLAAVPT